MAKLYPHGRGQGGERKRLKHVRAHAAADAIFFIRMRKISLVFVWCYATKAATMQTAKERQRQEKVSRDNLKIHPDSQPRNSCSLLNQISNYKEVSLSP